MNDSATRAPVHSHVSSFKTALKRNEMFTPREVLIELSVVPGVYSWYCITSIKCFHVQGPGPGTYCPSLIRSVPKVDNIKHR